MQLAKATATATRSQQRATLLIFLPVGIAQAAWAPLVPLTVAVLSFTLIAVSLANLVLLLQHGGGGRRQPGHECIVRQHARYAVILIGPAWIGCVVHAHGFAMPFGGVALLLLLVFAFAVGRPARAQRVKRKTTPADRRTSCCWFAGLSALFGSCMY
jgi:hypothetical protein